MDTILSNLTTITIILSFLGGILFKFISMESKITGLSVKTDYLEQELKNQANDLHDFEGKMLHGLERIESKLDSFIIGRNG